MNKNQRFPSPIDSFWSESHSLRHGVIDRNGCVWDMKNSTDSSPLHYYPFLRSYQSFQGTNLSRYFDGKSEVSHIRFSNQNELLVKWNDTTLHDSILSELGAEYIRFNYFGKIHVVSNQNISHNEMLILPSNTPFIQHLIFRENLCFCITMNNDILIYERDKSGQFKIQFSYSLAIPEIVSHWSVNPRGNTYLVCIAFRDGHIRIMHISKHPFDNSLQLTHWNKLDIRKDSIVDLLIEEYDLYILTPTQIFVYRFQSITNYPHLIFRKKLVEPNLSTKFYFYRNCILLNGKRYIHGFYVIQNTTIIKL